MMFVSFRIYAIRQPFFFAPFTCPDPSGVVKNL